MYSETKHLLTPEAYFNRINSFTTLMETCDTTNLYGLMQDCSTSIANALELLQPYIDLIFSVDMMLENFVVKVHLIGWKGRESVGKHTHLFRLDYLSDFLYHPVAINMNICFVYPAVFDYDVVLLNPWFKPLACTPGLFLAHRSLSWLLPPWFHTPPAIINGFKLLVTF